MNKWKKESDIYYVEEHSQKKTFLCSFINSKTSYFSINNNEIDEMGVSSGSGLSFVKDEDGILHFGYNYNDNRNYPSIMYDPGKKQLRIMLEMDEENYARKILLFDLTNGTLNYTLDDNENGFYGFYIDSSSLPYIDIMNDMGFNEASTPFADPFLKEVFKKPLTVGHKMRIRDFQSDGYSYRCENNKSVSECSGPNRYGVGVIDSSGNYGWDEYYTICEFFNNEKIEGWHLIHSDDQDSLFWTNDERKSELKIDIWQGDDDMYLSVYFSDNESPLIKYEALSGYLYIGQSDSKFFHKFKGPGLRFDMANGEILYLNFENNNSAKFVKRVRIDEDNRASVTSDKKSYYESNKANFTNYIKEHPEHFKKKSS